MPMRTLPSSSPGLRTHSCSGVYLRSSGYNGSASSTARVAGPGESGEIQLVRVDCRSIVLVLRRRVSVLRLLRLMQHVDGQLVVLGDRRVSVLILDTR